ncbi:restriction endonuclease subunit S, partial [uncultured Alistipes sp.]|uniref:restriction endonuclease subunit S n=2 Tax=Pseudomonadati TaxID=3379134 RepID=UPI00261F4BCA
CSYFFANVPHLRFPEFTGEWYKHSLGEIGETIVGLTYKPSDVVENNGIIVFRSSNIKDGAIDYSDLVRVNKNIKKRIITKEDDILVCARNGSQRLIGKNAIIKNKDTNNTFGAFMMAYRSKYNLFILPLLSTKRYFSQVAENLGARINQITASDFNRFEFYVPNDYIERAKIAELFRLLDERITVQNKIIEKLETLIKGIVDLSYDNSATTKKLGNVIAQISQRNKSGKEMVVLSVNNKQGFIEQSEQFEERIIASDDTSNYKMVCINDFAYNPARINVGSIARLKDKECGIVSPMYICFRTLGNMLPEYLELFFKTKRFALDVDKRLEGSVRLCLSYEGLCEIAIPIIAIEKQKTLVEKIASLYSKLDIEKKFLRNYKMQKQYLLSQMFI